VRLAAMYAKPRTNSTNGKVLLTIRSYNWRQPRQLFDGYLVNEGGPGIAGYDATPDGRFLMIAGSRFGPRTTQLNIILNWFEELRSHESASKR